MKRRTSSPLRNRIFQREREKERAIERARERREREREFVCVREKRESG
jgi:hypothetical protein